uniref:Uncharacterized protein n=1 Tax=Arundo donax TaxID=35708 RepID=A0A0A9BIH8_ARUDO
MLKVWTMYFHSFCNAQKQLLGHSEVSLESGWTKREITCKIIGIQHIMDSLLVPMKHDMPWRRTSTFRPLVALNIVGNQKRCHLVVIVIVGR